MSYFVNYLLYVPPVANDLHARTRQHEMADNEGVTKAVASFYRYHSDTVSLGLPCDPRPNIIPVNFF